ncbi:hypothetical protein SAMN02745166_03444 [Prosthecobacter debontii]|uniref:DUF2239 domain-containing protein n=1 Tax=Prosthecobacter debontii TaxID=48467 RepID=A0A1T4YIW1_9BACT|nr:DUF2239 family protein [Prosthecobacter debontii]SKB01722.1 hypothetical protein SAMN02745166_03444 [Prosthecobacter debontii]
MPSKPPPASSFLCTAFTNHRRLTSGPLDEVVRSAKAHLETQSNDGEMEILIFRDATGEQVDVDLRGALPQLLQHLPVLAALPDDEEVPENTAPTGPGRPKLGVTAREVTLLPRHWAWLNEQPGGASVTLRKLVEEAKRASHTRDQVRRAEEATYRFMAAMGGNLPHFEAASRALFAHQRPALEQALADWPVDIRDYTLQLAAKVFTAES